MAIDLNLIKKKHQELTKPKSGGMENNSNVFWNPPEGTTTIRILPSKDDDTPFYSETKIHRIRKPGNNFESNVHCLEVKDGRGKCPLCDLYRALYKTKVKEHEALARAIKPRERYFLNIVLRDTGDVKVFSLGSKLFKKILGIIVDPDFGDITDWDSGRDFKVQKSIIEGYPNYDQSGAKPKASPAGSPQDIARFKETMHDLAQFVKTEDYESVKTIAMEAAPLDLVNYSGSPELAKVNGAIEASKRGQSSENDFNKLRA
jgi:hypothetical protein